MWDTGHREMQRDTERHRDAERQRDTERHRETQRDTKRHRETEKETETTSMETQRGRVRQLKKNARNTEAEKI